MLEQIKSWLDLAQVGQSRSSITNPLQWTLVILIGGVVLLVLVHVPTWIVAVPTGGIVLVMAVFIYAYLYFMHTKPDVLRSEEFHLQKMAIEHGLMGDSIHGLVGGAARPADISLKLLGTDGEADAKR